MGIQSRSGPRRRAAEHAYYGRILMVSTVCPRQAEGRVLRLTARPYYLWQFSLTFVNGSSANVLLGLTKTDEAAESDNAKKLFDLHPIWQPRECLLLRNTSFFFGPTRMREAKSNLFLFLFWWRPLFSALSQPTPPRPSPAQAAATLTQPSRADVAMWAGPEGA